MKYLKSLSLAVAIVAMMGTVVYAESTNGNSTTAGSTSGQGNYDMFEKGADQQEQRCEMAQNLIQTREQKYTQAHNRYEEHYAGVIGKLEELEQQLGERNGDTTELALHIEELKRIQSEFNNSYQQMIASSATARVGVCSGSSSQAEGGVEAMRADVSEMRDSAAEMKAYLRTEVIPTLEDLKEVN